jgi:hypothetical protein
VRREIEMKEDAGLSFRRGCGSTRSTLPAGTVARRAISAGKKDDPGRLGGGRKGANRRSGSARDSGAGAEN